MERLIQLAISLPDGSVAQSKLTGTLLKGLWDSLLHPPLSYLGDDYEYRTADGSNNVISSQQIFIAQIHWLMRFKERLLSETGNGRFCICKKCHSIDYWETVPRSGRGV